MPTEVQILRELVGAGSTVPDSDLQDNLDTAVEMVAKYLLDNAVAVGDVPTSVMKRATRAVAREMFTQDEAPNGILNQQYDTGDGIGSTPIRIGADPLRPAYPLLKMWVGNKQQTATPRGSFPAAQAYPDPASRR